MHVRNEEITEFCPHFLSNQSVFRYPSAPCSFIEKKYYSSCLQKHNFVRLLAYTYDQGLHIDSFKMPIACSCHISEFANYG